MCSSFRYTIIIHPHSGWYFSFGHSPNTTGCAQVRYELACQPRTNYWLPINGLRQRLVKPPSGREVAEEATPTRSEGARRAFANGSLLVHYAFSPSHGYRRASPLPEGAFPATAGLFIAKAFPNHATIAWFSFTKRACGSIRRLFFCIIHAVLYYL